MRHWSICGQYGWQLGHTAGRVGYMGSTNWLGSIIRGMAQLALLTYTQPYCSGTSEFQILIKTEDLKVLGPVFQFARKQDKRSL